MGVEGKIVLVTGASRGIGAATVMRLAAAGGRIVAASRDEAGLRRVADAARGGPGEVVAIGADVRSTPDVERAIDTALERFGGLDALVNNAAIGGLGRVVEQSEEDWQDVLSTNVLGTLRCCRAAIPALERRGGGTIVNLSSVSADDGFPHLAVYSASKAAILSLSSALRREVSEQRIRIATIRIHGVASEFLNAYPAERVTEAVGQWMRDGLMPAARRLIAPARVAEAIEFVIGAPPEASINDLEIRPLGG